jgi:hypothetical protein
VNAHPELVRRILDEGHEIGSHTYTHAELAELPGWRRQLELSLTRKAIAGATGREVTLFRPPFSSGPASLTAPQYEALREAAATGHVAVLADRDTKDWRRPGTPVIIRTATPEPGRGAVVLMHDGGGDRAQTVAALEQLLPTLTTQGYRFTGVSEGVGAPPSMLPASPGSRGSGIALRWTQAGAGGVTTAMNMLLAIALVLGVGRLLVQVVCAQVHVRRVRRPAYDRPPVLAPVSVIVPAYNESANIAATVRSLVSSSYPALEVIVVDDGSSDDTAGIVERMRLRGVRVIRQANAGKPAAPNTGIRAARATCWCWSTGTPCSAGHHPPAGAGFADPTVGAISGNTKVANRRRLLAAGSTWST